jgi:hypothetical protein
MLEAIHSFTAQYDGELVQVRSGRTRVIEGHPIALEHPDCFEPLRGERRPARDRIHAGGTAHLRTATVALPSQPRHLESWRLLGRSRSCRVGYRDSATRLRFTAEARAGVLAELELGDPGRETGAILYGAAHETLIEILAAVGAGPHAVRERSLFRFDPEWCRERDLEMAARGLLPIGEMHSHPNGGGAPSPADLEAWHARGAAFPAYLGLIATLCRAGWQLTPWVVRASGICEQAPLP